VQLVHMTRGTAMASGFEEPYARSWIQPDDPFQLRQNKGADLPYYVGRDHG